MTSKKMKAFRDVFRPETWKPGWRFTLKSPAIRIPTPLNWTREGQSVTLCGGYIFVLGGHPSDNYVNNGPVQSAMFNIVTDEWSPIALDVEETFHSACLVDDKIVCIGGFKRNEHTFGGFTESFLNVYDITLGSYVHKQTSVGLDAMPLMPNRCGRHTAEFFESKREIVIYGGRGHEDVYLDQFYALNVDSMQWRPLKSKGKTPGVQSSHSSCLQGDNMMLFCNFDNPVLSDLFVCDYSRSIPHWSTLQKRGMSPPGVYSAALNLVDNWLILCGGYIYGADAQVLYVYDMNNGLWYAAAFDRNDAKEQYRFYVKGYRAELIGRHRGLHSNGKIRYYGGDVAPLNYTFELELGSLRA